MKSSKNSIKEIIISIIIAMCAMLLIASLVSLIKYSSYMEDEAKSTSALYVDEMVSALEKNITEYNSKSYLCAKIVSDMQDEVKIKEYLTSINYSQSDKDNPDADFYNVAYVNYVKDGELYTSVGDLIKNGNKKIMSLIGSPSPCYSGIFYDEERKMNFVGFYSPVADCDYMSGIILYYPMSVFQSFLQEKQTDKDSFSALCTKDGIILSIYKNEFDFIYRNGNIIDLIKQNAQISDSENSLSSSFENSKDGSYTIKINNIEYVVSVGTNKSVTNDLFIISIFNIESINELNLEFYNSIVGIIFGFTAIAILLIAFFITQSKQVRKEKRKVFETNDKLKCLNRIGFINSSNKLLNQNKKSEYAVVYCEYRYFKHIMEQYGSSAISSSLSYINLICTKTIQTGETYGYDDQGIFYLLLHYIDDNELLQRLKIMNSLAKKYQSEKDLVVKLSFGIYTFKREEESDISKMILYAKEARESFSSLSPSSTRHYNFYSSEYKEINMRRDDIELHMERALKDGEFRIFYQPKYNIQESRIDGAEALVRWYNPEKNIYNAPVLFIPVFEANGFIVKLDNYVYKKVCEYLGESIERGQTIYPVSVNVSRITALQPNFVDFYTKIKNYYKICDNFITIEFTESFAYDNYAKLSVIIKDLHNNGFLCSIDDFGSVYSSYNILKALPMDEIKLDKFFIEKGIDEERDNSIIESVVSVAKKIGMKVTSEGVESAGDVDRLKKLGVDVIQGFCYSHPLMLSDYILFINHKRKIL